MTFNITQDQMTKYLTRLGYEIKSEVEKDEVNFYQNQFQEVERRVVNCYYNGNKMAVEAGFGVNRLKYCFEQEFLKRLLEL